MKSDEIKQPVRQQVSGKSRRLNLINSEV